MKAKSYITFYGLLSMFPVTWRLIRKKSISIADFLTNNPDYELSDLELDRIYSNETYSLSNILERFKVERELISFLRSLFDDYRSEGGEPLQWLYFTFNSVSLNPKIYPAEHLGVIEKNLIQWIDNFKNQPFDALKDYTKEKGANYQQPNKPKAPVIALFCSIINDSGIMEKGTSESNQSFSERICNEFKLKYTVRVSKGLHNSDNKRNRGKIKNLILPIIDIENSKKITNYLDTKHPTEQNLFV